MKITTFFKKKIKFFVGLVFVIGVIIIFTSAIYGFFKNRLSVINNPFYAFLGSVGSLNLNYANEVGIKETKGNHIDSVRILFTGDMMYDRYIRKVSSVKGQDYILSCISPLLQSVDMVVGNLEGPITTNTSVSLGSVVGSPNNYQFTFATSTAELLKRHNFQIVNIGNNHIGNFGLEGVSSTKEYLKRAGVGYFGGLKGSDSVYRTTIQGVLISFVSYNQFGGDSVDTITRVIAEEKKTGNTVVVYTHWGEEYIDATPQIKRFAHLFVDSGADLIIGSHPHVVQSHEVYKSVPIYYSLGNFVFDQYFSADVKNGLTLLVSLTKQGEIQIEEIPVEIGTDGRVCVAKEK